MIGEGKFDIFCGYVAQGLVKEGFLWPSSGTGASKMGVYWRAQGPIKGGQWLKSMGHHYINHLSSLMDLLIVFNIKWWPLSKMKPHVSMQCALCSVQFQCLVVWMVNKWTSKFPKLPNFAISLSTQLCSSLIVRGLLPFSSVYQCISKE